jgi:uncharacterized RmlC-like cupin family protein
MIQLTHPGDSFTDHRGVIRNLLDHSCGGVQMIWSNARSRRSDHYHREDGHWLYIVSGECEYYERPVGSKEKPERVTMLPGDMVYTGPGLEHATLFPIDTVMVSMSLRPRDHESHEADLIRLSEPLPLE